MPRFSISHLLTLQYNLNQNFKNQLMKKRSSLLLALVLGGFMGIGAQEKVDIATVEKIKKEGFTNSKVMDIAFNLTDVSGPRLTISAGFTRAANYAMAKLKEWGLTNVQLDPWGEFGKGWELKKCYVAMKAPYYKSMIAIPKAWTKGTNGLQTADVLVISAKDTLAFAAYKGKLKSKILLIDRSDEYRQSFEPDAARFTDSELNKMANPVAPAMLPGDTTGIARRQQQFQAARLVNNITNAVKNMAKQEGALAILTTSTRNHDGTVFVQGGGSFKTADPENFLDVAMAWEDYMTLLRLAKSGVDVKMDIDIATSFTTTDTKGYNVIAEIKGTDKNLKDEIVMLGGHLDSWHGSTGATDNAAGCAIMMEAVRILLATGIKPRRTIRIALWSGEEEGLFGSRGYVKKTFADPATMQLLAAHQKLSAYYNVDNGTGKIRGIYLQGNEAVKDIFAEWLQPFSDMGAKTVTVSNTGGTDHVVFNAVGLPGFQFIQDDIEYNTRTHHSNMDSYDHLVADDLVHSATLVAAFVYNTAQREEKLPRKELPKAGAGARN